jgi:NAD(P)-dependent dehydrogenase (short-subunit alcohol dehydrogenase family)
MAITAIIRTTPKNRKTFMPASPLQGKVALVTGAGSPIGIGRHLTMALVGAGARVAMLDRNNEWLEQTLAEARAAGGADCAFPIIADITDSSAADRAVQSTLGHFGALHVLFNNAGTSPTAEGLMPDVRGQVTNFWDITPEAWLRVVAVNFTGAFFMSRAAVRPMLAQKWGRIISVTTSLDTMYRKGNAPYGPSKAGHEALIATMAQELEGSGVTANVLTPGGGTNTNLIPKSVPEAYRNALIKPEVMRAPAVWLSSNASDGFNGQRIIAARWDESLPISERLEKSAAPAAWPQLGAQSVRPADA